jgi:hypothetical protein
MCIDTRAAAATASQDSGVCGHAFLPRACRYLLALECNMPMMHVHRATRSNLLMNLPRALGLTVCQRQALESDQKTVEHAGVELGARCAPPAAATKLDARCTMHEKITSYFGGHSPHQTASWPGLRTLHACKIQSAMRCPCTVATTARQSGSSTARLVRVQACRGLRCVPAAGYDWIAPGNGGLAV